MVRKVNRRGKDGAAGQSSSAKQTKASRKASAQSAWLSSPAVIQQLAATLATAMTDSRPKKRKRKARRQDSSSSSSSSSDDESEGESSDGEDADEPSSSMRATSKQSKTKGRKSPRAVNFKKPPAKKSKDGAAKLSSSAQKKMQNSAKSAASGKAKKRGGTGLGDESSSESHLGHSPQVVVTLDARDVDDHMSSGAAEAAANEDAGGSKRKKKTPAADVKAPSYFNGIPLAHSARSFVLPQSLMEKHDLKTFPVLGESDADPEFSLLSASRSVLPNLDVLDGLVNLSRLTQAERYAYIRHLVSAAQWNPKLRANIRLCMLVNARSTKDIFYLILRVWDMALLNIQKTPVDNFYTLLYNYLEILFAQRWYVMRPGKLTRTDLDFYGQRGENFRKYVRYLELFFARPNEFCLLVEESVKDGLVSGQDLAAVVVQKFVGEESNLKAWFAMQHRANIRAHSTRRNEMDVVPDFAKDWIGQKDEEAAEMLMEFARSFNDACGTETQHWLDDYPFEQTLEPAEFTRLMNFCHSTIVRKIYTNKALSVSARRLSMHLATEVKCNDFITVAGEDTTVHALAAQLGALTMDSAQLELASATEDSWTTKLQFIRFHENDDAQTTALTLRLPIQNAAEFKTHLLSTLYENWVAEDASDAVESASQASNDTDGPVSATTAKVPLRVVTDSGAVSAVVQPPPLPAAIVQPLPKTAYPTNTATMWSTRSLCTYWESPLPSSHREAKTLVFTDDEEHSLKQMREHLLQELTSVGDGDITRIDNDSAVALLHEEVAGYMSLHPLDVVVTVDDGFWELAPSSLLTFQSIQLRDCEKVAVPLQPVRCLVGFSTVGDQRVLIAAFAPAGILVTTAGLSPHCSIVILGCLDDGAALKSSFVAAQIQLARTLCTTTTELAAAHWIPANCVGLSTISNDLDEEEVNVVLVQQFLRLLFVSTLPSGPSLRVSLIEEVESSASFLQTAYERLNRTVLVSITETRSAHDEKWQQNMEDEIRKAMLTPASGGDLIDVANDYNEEVGVLMLRTVLLLSRNHSLAGNYIQHGRVSSEFGSASSPLITNHQRELQTWPQFGSCLEFRFLTLFGYVPLGLSERAWLFTDEDGLSFVYNPRSLTYWRDGEQLERDGQRLLSRKLADSTFTGLPLKRLVNLPYM